MNLREAVCIYEELDKIRLEGYEGRYLVFFPSLELKTKYRVILASSNDGLHHILNLNFLLRMQTKI